MHKTKVSRAVAELERRKYLTRRTNRADLREAFLSLHAGWTRGLRRACPARARIHAKALGGGGASRPRRVRPCDGCR